MAHLDPAAGQDSDRKAVDVLWVLRLFPVLYDFLTLGAALWWGGRWARRRLKAALQRP